MPPTCCQFYGYKKTFAEGMIGYGSAIAVAVFLISLTLSLIYLRLSQASRLEGSRPMKRHRCFGALFRAALRVYCLLPFLWFALTSLEECRGVDRDPADA